MRMAWKTFRHCMSKKPCTELPKTPSALTVLRTHNTIVVMCSVQDSLGVKKTLRYQSELAGVTRTVWGPSVSVTTEGG
jgi:hypothetical protein